MPSPTIIHDWQIENQHATGSARAFHAKLDLAHPERGLESAQIAAIPAPAPLLAIAPTENASSWPAKLSDAYVRGHDLVTTYSGADAWPFSPTIYWSADEVQSTSEAIASLRLMISIQTHLLDTHPRLDVRTSLPADEVVMISLVGDDVLVDSHGEGVQNRDPRAVACALVWRFSGAAVSYAELMPTSDFYEFIIDRGAGAIGSRWRLFGEFLEKGVIRRARLQSLVIPRENDIQLVAEACDTIERLPLPLTT